MQLYARELYAFPGIFGTRNLLDVLLGACLSLPGHALLHLLSLLSPLHSAALFLRHGPPGRAALFFGHRLAFFLRQLCPGLGRRLCKNFASARGENRATTKA